MRESEREREREGERETERETETERERERERAVPFSPVRAEELRSVDGPNIFKHFHNQTHLPK